MKNGGVTLWITKNRMAQVIFLTNYLLFNCSVGTPVKKKGM